MDEELRRVFGYATEFFMKKLGLIVIFSIPFLLASLLLIIVAAPTYLALGGVFLRTGSIPEISILDLVISVCAYAVALFIISDTLVNVNLIIRAKRTKIQVKGEILNALGTYATRIFYVYTLVLLVLFFIQLLTYNLPFQEWIYPISALILSFLTFFVAPAVVIDNSDAPTAIRRSVSMALRNPTLIFVWAVVGLISVSVVEFILMLILPSPFSGYLTLLVNSLIVVPYLIVLQTQMYMEKYPLAR